MPVYDMTDWNPFNLGIWDQLGWTPPGHPHVERSADALRAGSSSGSAPPEKKAKMSKQFDAKASVSSKSKLQLKTKTEERRFVSPINKLETYQKSYCPENMKVNTCWAVNNFGEWRREYNLRHPEKPCPDEILLTDNPNDLAFWLQRYALSTRKKNGEKYPTKTVYLLLCGLQRHMKEAKDECISEKQREDACKTLAHGTPTYSYSNVELHK